MTTITAPSATARPGDIGPTVSRRPRFTSRRRLLLLGCLLLVVAVALAVNHGPVRDYRDARARFEKTTAEVAALEKQRAALQSQLDKLSQAGYLEGLARQELTYARPGEDLYIVTGLSGEDAAETGGAGGSTGGSAGPRAGTGIGAAVPGAESVAGLGIGAAGPDADKAGADGADEPGFLERMLSAVTGLF